MGQKEKLIMRIKNIPKDFTLAEAETLLGYFGYYVHNKGKTSGSRMRFYCAGRAVIDLHRPHPGNILKPYQVKQIVQTLEQEGLI